MSRPSVSGIAIDTFLFSRIGMPLFHRYRVFDHLGSHPAFRGQYMSTLFTFLKESGAESIRRSHRRRAKEIAVSISKSEQGRSDRHHVVTTVGSTYSGLEDNRPGSGPVSNTDGRRAPAVVDKLYLPSVGGGRYSTGPDGLVIATVCHA